MKKTFTESQIVSAVKRTEAGMKTSEVARELGVSSTTINNWKSYSCQNDLCKNTAII